MKTSDHSVHFAATGSGRWIGIAISADNHPAILLVLNLLAVESSQAMPA
ncbi:hypothetical protein [Caballeronia sp. LZ035]|nr:hypothetical protein [Caballeronia sp. LZ035]MDR5760662.1 hypothetical protein [Caballeronia sp. LZ035]